MNSSNEATTATKAASAAASETAPTNAAATGAVKATECDMDVEDMPPPRSSLKRGRKEGRGGQECQGKKSGRSRVERTMEHAKSHSAPIRPLEQKVPMLTRLGASPLPPP